MRVERASSEQRDGGEEESGAQLEPGEHGGEDSTKRTTRARVGFGVRSVERRVRRDRIVAIRIGCGRVGVLRIGCCVRSVLVGAVARGIVLGVGAIRITSVAAVFSATGAGARLARGGEAIVVGIDAASVQGGARVERSGAGGATEAGSLGHGGFGLGVEGARDEAEGEKQGEKEAESHGGPLG